MRIYNVFRSRARDVLCAVPEDRPVPSFVTSKSWEFTGRIEDPIVLPKATEVAVRFNGFYIFHPFERLDGLHKDNQRPSDPNTARSPSVEANW